MPIDYKEYPVNWKTEIRPSVLKRAKNCCEECGVPNHSVVFRGYIIQDGKKVNVYQDVEANIYKADDSTFLYNDEFEGDVLPIRGDNQKATKIILTIAHLDHDKHNHDVSLDRLKALCQRCHLRYDLAHHVRNRKYGRKQGEQPKLF